MKLTWHDATATATVALAGGLYWAHLADADVPLLSGTRVTAVLVFGLGVVACVFGGGAVPGDGAGNNRGGWPRWSAPHGAVAFALLLITLITGNDGVLAALAVVIGLMWLITTLRRALRGGSADRVHSIRPGETST